VRHQLLIAEFMSTPWALMPERLAAFQVILARWASDIKADPAILAEVRADAVALDARKGDLARAGNGSIAVLPMYGVIAQRTNVSDISGPGVMSTQAFAQDFRAALADDSIGGILIDVDSPGGSVYGVGELADEIYSARATKPVVAVANSLAASAAYWLASSAGEFYVTPSGEVGSIGVISAHEDLSEKLKAAGVKTTLITAGKYKAEGNPFEPLGQEARDNIQSRVNDYYGAMTRAIAKNRATDVATVREGMGQGRVLTPSDARAANMVDGIATFDQVVKKMQRSIAQGGVAQPAPGTKPRGQSIALCRKEMDILGA